MKLRQKLRTTHIGELGAGSLTDSLPSERTTVPGRPPEDGPLPAEGDIVGGCYRLVSRLGEGMFGSVFEAERTDVPEHRVALKVVESTAYAGRNVARELVMLAAATHPNIVQLKDHGVERDYVWLTMALYEGETLAERLERGPLGMREAYEIFRPIARGVQALHDRGLRHQDIKPENIFLAQLGEAVHPVLLDLGVAVEKHATFVAGTALFGAPEQVIALGGIEGTAQLSEKMDTYGLASTLLLSLVGREHFPGERATTPYHLAQAFADREEQPLDRRALEELTGASRRAVEAAFARWLQRDPDRRPKMGALADELEVLLEPEREAARSIEAGIERQRQANRRMRVALASVALLAGTAGAVAYSHRETLRLAGELRVARAEGAASFGQLDTCVAAHQVSEQAAARCDAGRRQERSRHEQAMADLQQSTAAAEQAFSRRLATVNTRLSTCRDEAEEAAEAFAQERDDLVADRLQVERTLREREASWQESRATLVAQRDEASEERDRLAGEMVTVAAVRSELASELEGRTREWNSCLSSLSACSEERDICLNERPAPAKPAAGGSGAESREVPPDPSSGPEVSPPTTETTSSQVGPT